MYLDLIISKSERCRAALGILELLVSFLMRANRAFMHIQLTGKKWLHDFGPVTVISCETVLFFTFGLHSAIFHIWITDR